MAFQLKKRDSFTSDIVVEAEKENGKLEELGRFQIEYKRPTQRQIEDFFSDLKQDEADLRRSEFLGEWILAVKDLNGEDGQPLTPEIAKAAVIDDPEFSALAFAAFFHGLRPARERAAGQGKKRG